MGLEIQQDFESKHSGAEIEAKLDKVDTTGTVSEAIAATKMAYQAVSGATPTVQLAWGTVHQLTDYPTSIGLTLPAAPADSRVESVLKFTTGTTAPTVNFPTTLIWAGKKAVPIEADTTYEFSISYDMKAGKYTIVGEGFGAAT